MTVAMNRLLEQTELLTAEEQLQLAAYLIEKARRRYQTSTKTRKWRDIRGLARPNLLGEDAQVYISRARQEADEHRNQQLEQGL